MQRKILIKGTLILTFTGIATRLIGFFYRIFLSRSFGETAVGLYQLIFPVYALAISFTSAGIQTAVSRSVAREHTLHRDKKCTCLLYTGIGLSFLLSMITMYLLQHYNSAIAIHFLHEPRCMFSITAMSYAIPFASIHSCISWILPGVKADTYSGIFTTDRADFPGCFCLSIIYRFYEKRFPCERCSRSCRTCSRRIFLYELQPVYSSQQTGYYTCA